MLSATAPRSATTSTEVVLQIAWLKTYSLVYTVLGIGEWRAGEQTGHRTSTMHARPKAHLPVGLYLFWRHVQYLYSDASVKSPGILQWLDG